MPKTFNPTLATWNRKRGGKRVKLYTVNWRCPDTGRKRGSVKAQTMRGYAPLLKIIVGTLLQGTPQERAHHALTGEKPRHDTKLLLMLGEFRVSGLTTAQLRQWHNRVCKEVGIPTANRCMFILKSILALAEEDYGVVPASSQLI